MASRHEFKLFRKNVTYGLQATEQNCKLKAGECNTHICSQSLQSLIIDVLEETYALKDMISFH